VLRRLARSAPSSDAATCSAHRGREGRVGAVRAARGHGDRGEHALEGDPALVNRDPYGGGWMIKLRANCGGARPTFEQRRVPEAHRAIASSVMLTLTFHGHAASRSKPTPADDQSTRFSRAIPRPTSRSRGSRRSTPWCCRTVTETTWETRCRSRGGTARDFRDASWPRFCGERGATVHAMHIGGGESSLRAGQARAAFHGAPWRETRRQFTHQPCGLVVTMGGHTVFTAVTRASPWKCSCSRARGRHARSIATTTPWHRGRGARREFVQPAR